MSPSITIGSSRFSEINGGRVKKIKQRILSTALPNSISCQFKENALNATMLLNYTLGFTDLDLIRTLVNQIVLCVKITCKARVRD